MVRRAGLIALAGLLAVGGAVLAEDNSGRIYGRITTTDGDVYRGLIRWDKNETNWCDILNGTKELSDEDRDRSSRSRRSKRTTRIEVFGIKIGESDGDFSWSGSASSGIRFGHIKSLEVDGDDEAIIELKSGQTVTLSEGSTDIGSDIREIIIEDEKQGETELAWDDIERVDLEPAKTGEASVFGERLYGTVTTRRGDEYTGFVCWDIDEVFTNDLLEGEQKDRDRKVKFDRIASIARYSASAASVALKSGEELVLRGSNDVDESNRGILVADPGFGQVQIEWDDFDKLVFSQAPQPLTYADFDGGRPLSGTVYTEDGDSYTGTIRWDNDEESTWEFLDGAYRNCEFDIEFGLIKEISKQSFRASKVTTWDGRTFVLRGSNDVDEDNKGIFITTSPKGREVEVDWDEFSRVEFTRK
ncbi:MAG: hypothetical protein AB1644_01945 [Candidatus Zixiibacteriota bacterium]